MYIHLLLPSSPFLLLFLGNVLVRFTVSSLCCTSVWSIRNAKGILPTAQSECIAVHFTSSGKTSTAESATIMWKFIFNKCWLEHPEFSWSKAVLINESEAQCMLCKRTLKFGTLSVKAQVWHTKSETHRLASKSLQRSHAIRHFCMPKFIHFCSTRTLMSRSQVTLQPSLSQLWRWNRRCFGFWTPCVYSFCVCVCMCACMYNNPGVCVQNK